MKKSGRIDHLQGMMRWIIPCFLFPMTGQTQTTAISEYQNYFIADTVIVARSLVNANELQVVYYPDSIPPQEWMVERPLVYMSVSPFEEVMETFIPNAWCRYVDRNELRVLSIINRTGDRKIVYTSTAGYAAITMQALGSNGWIDIPERQVQSGVPMTQSIDNNTKLNLLVRPPVGHQETQLRYKLLVAIPPHFPTKQFIYTDPFPGSLDASYFQNRTD